jgi:hypothetical protein
MKVLLMHINENTKFPSKSHFIELEVDRIVVFMYSSRANHIFLIHLTLASFIGILDIIPSPLTEVAFLKSCLRKEERYLKHQK